MSYFTCLEASNVDKYITFAWFWEWKALGGKINCILRVWKVPGGSKCGILRVWKFKTSINTLHLLDFKPQEDLEGSGRLNVLSFTCLED